ncbi:MAG: hypothetical protein M3345_03955 [Actinomycetota bacterium]|nr:hypothetical protein [Actinomycetota bacterium]
MPPPSHSEPSEETAVTPADPEADPAGPSPVPSRDAGFWSKNVSTLSVGEVPQEAINRNVTGKRVTSPIQGFGKMWQKSYRVALTGVAITPPEVIAEWKEKFPQFWPKGNAFYGPLTGIAPGDVALLNLSMPGKLKLSTGVLVLYADDESFTLMTPQGHMFAGWITFSAFEKNGATVAQAQVLMRANDPVYELGLTLGGHGQEDRFWAQTLASLAAHLGAPDAKVETDVVCIDKKRQWSNSKNVWHNSALRSGFYMMGTPFRAAARPFRKRSGQGQSTEDEGTRRDPS